MSATKILPCNCPNEFQDERYGKGMRLHNLRGVDGKSGHRCTSCGKATGGMSVKSTKEEKK